MKRVVVLGSTGSIGEQALEVIACSPEMQLVGLSCNSNVERLLVQAKARGCKDVAVGDPVAAERLSCLDGLSVRRGVGAAGQLLREVEADIVLNAIVGFAGLESTLVALEHGRAIALANKESMVCAGSLVRSLGAQKGARILPVDSEHSALFQLIEAAGRGAVRSVVITGSGGPFRGWESERLRSVTREQALAHPTWSMGEKISIDSATLMNKGLEVIEAHHLFDLSYDDIDVVMHPQSIVHGMVRMVDGALLAHMGRPDMKVPIAFALRYPDRGVVETPRLDFNAGLSLDFGLPDETTFPAIRMAREAGAAGDRCTCALNAANEVAVRAFLAGSLGFLEITKVVAAVMDTVDAGVVGTYEEAVAVDAWARQAAERQCAGATGERSRGNGS